MIKIIRGLDITTLGVCVYNRKWQSVHLQQGDMDGACAVYSMMMNLIVLKVFTRNQVTNLNTSFKGNTAKGRLFKEFFVKEGLCRDGFYFSEIKEKLSHSFAKEVMSSVRQYMISQSAQASYVEELKNGGVQSLIKENPDKLFIFIAHEDRGEPYTSTAKMIKRLADRIIRVQGLTAFVGGRLDGEKYIISQEKAMLIHGSQIVEEK